MQKDHFEYQIELLWKEIDILQQNIRVYDTLLMAIKSSAITIFTAFIVLAARDHRPEFLLPCGIAIVLFWVLDSILKSFQRAYIVRYNKVEHVLRKDLGKAVKRRSFKGLLPIPDIRARVSMPRRERWKKLTPLKGAFYLHTCLVYVAMVICTGVAYLLLA